MAKTIWDYARQVASECNMSIPNDSPFFVHSQDLGISAIRSGDYNRVLLFPGAFNPPHHGHLSLLLSILRNMKKHLNIRNVIIYPHGDQHISEKIGEENPKLHLTQAERSALWRNADEFPANDTWVYEGSKRSLTRFQRALQKCMKRENINLTFLLLVGSDWMSTRGIYDPGQWNCNEVITSDVSRPVDFRCEYTLRQLPACSHWTLHTFKVVHDEHHQDALHGTPGHDIVGDNLNARLWSTSTIRRPIRRYYFVPYSCPSPAEVIPPSSTAIRQRILEDNVERRPIDENTVATALSPGILLVYVRDKLPVGD